MVKGFKSLLEQREFYYPGFYYRFNNRMQVLIDQIVWHNQNRFIKGWYFNLLKLLFKKDYFFIPRIDLVLTARCTLRCKYCANLMQYYQKPQDVPCHLILESTRQLLESVDYIREIMVLGGEPFLYKKLVDVLELLNSSKKIGKVTIITNATLCPESGALIKQLKNSKVCIRISDYKLLSRKMKELILLLEKEKIRYVREKQRFWYDTGDLMKRNRTSEEQDKVFKDCSTLCRSFFRGEFFYCPRQAHGTDLGLIPKKDNEAVKFSNYSSNKTLKEALRKFCGRNSPIEACDYCDIRTPGYEERHIMPAEQLGDYKNVKSD